MLENIRYELIEMAEAEAIRLFRIARRAIEHDCTDTATAIRNEAFWLHTTGTAYPERLLDRNFKYAFKYAFK